MRFHVPWQNFVDMGSPANLAMTARTASKFCAHIRAALNLGCSRTEVREVLIQTCTFAGFAKSTQACKLAQDIFDELDTAMVANRVKKKIVRRPEG